MTVIRNVHFYVKYFSDLLFFHLVNNLDDDSFGY